MIVTFCLTLITGDPGKEGTEGPIGLPGPAGPAGERFGAFVCQFMHFTLERRFWVISSNTALGSSLDLIMGAAKYIILITQNKILIPF